jgi:hypothetical protein
MSNLEKHRIELSSAERQRLQELAAQTRSRPTSGVNAYQPSWKMLIRLIGQGQLDVVEREPYQLPPGLVEQAEAVTERQRQRKAPVKLEQMHMPLELEPA